MVEKLALAISSYEDREIIVFTLGAGTSIKKMVEFCRNITQFFLVHDIFIVCFYEVISHPLDLYFLEDWKELKESNKVLVRRLQSYSFPLFSLCLCVPHTLIGHVKIVNTFWHGNLTLGGHIFPSLEERQIYIKFFCQSIFYQAFEHEIIEVDQQTAVTSVP